MYDTTWTWQAQNKESAIDFFYFFFIFNNHDLQSNQNDPAYMDCSLIVIIK